MSLESNDGVLAPPNAELVQLKHALISKTQDLESALNTVEAHKNAIEAQTKIVASLVAILNSTELSEEDKATVNALQAESISLAGKINLPPPERLYSRDFSVDSFTAFDDDLFEDNSSTLSGDDARSKQGSKVQWGCLVIMQTGQTVNTSPHQMIGRGSNRSHLAQKLEIQI